jgi:hypothetical protein
MRGVLASVFALIFAATVAGGAYAAMTGVWVNGMDRFFEVILPAETALLGSAVGFYFGTQAGQAGPK